MIRGTAIKIITDNFTGVVDTPHKSPLCSQGIIDCSKSTAAVDETVCSSTIYVGAHDLAIITNRLRIRAICAKRIVECSIDISVKYEPMRFVACVIKPS